MKKRMIIAMATGLTVGCSKQTKTSNPPPPDPAPTVKTIEPEPIQVLPKDPPIKTNPGPPAVPPAVVTLPTLPAWDEVRSNHPEGATNPPRPIVIVTQSGECFKDWVGGMLKPTPETSSRIVKTCAGIDCGTEIQCNDEGSKMFAEWKAKHP